MKQANHNKKVHLIISGIHFIFHMDEEWNSKWYLLVFTKLIIGLRIAIGIMNWNLCDYPLLQHSKDIIVMCMIISSLTSMRLVHIVHASQDHA